MLPRFLGPHNAPGRPSWHFWHWALAWPIPYWCSLWGMNQRIIGVCVWVCEREREILLYHSAFQISKSLITKYYVALHREWLTEKQRSISSFFPRTTTTAWALPASGVRIPTQVSLVVTGLCSLKPSLLPPHAFIGWQLASGPEPGLTLRRLTDPLTNLNTHPRKEEVCIVWNETWHSWYLEKNL